MNDEQQLLGEPYEVEWRGRTLRFGGVTEGLKSKCVAAGKLTAIREHRENLEIFFSDTDADTQAARKVAIRDFEEGMATGAWKWGGSLHERWRREPEGLIVFIKALLEAGGTHLSKREIEDYCAERTDELQAIILLCLWDINSPNEPRPAALQAMTGLLIRPKSTASSAPNAG